MTRKTQTKNLRLEIKALGSREFEGHGSVFGNVDLGGDIVARGAFKDTLAQHSRDGTMPQLFWMHQPDQVPGKWVEMEEDEKGLRVRGVLASTPLGDEMHTLLKMKALHGLSIGFRIVDREWRDDEEYGAVRVLKAIDLWEVSLVSLAMNPLARVTASKSRLSELGEYVPLPSELEDILRDAGMSRAVAKTMVSKMRRGGLADEAEPGLREADGTSEADVLRALKASEEAIQLSAILAKIGNPL
jgi:HK97 family phage prohead protease